MRAKTFKRVNQFMVMLFIIGITFNVSTASGQTTKTSPTQKEKNQPTKVVKKPKKEKKEKVVDKETKPTKPLVVADPGVKNPGVKDSITFGSGEAEVTVPFEPIVDELPKGKVDWTNQFIEAKGESVIDTLRFKNIAQAKLMAKRGAIVDAQRNLLEITKGVQVTSETKVQDMIATYDYIYSRVDGVIKNATQVGEAIEKEGIITVTMRIPMYDQKGLAPVLHDQVMKKMNSTMQPITTEGNSQETGVAGTEITDMSNLAINFNGKKYDPSMFPIITDEKGNVLIDYSKIYDPKKGKFPKIVSAGKSILEAFGLKKGVEVLNVIESADGKIKVDTSAVKNKINWAKIGKVASTIGKFALALVL